MKHVLYLLDEVGKASQLEPTEVSGPSGMREYHHMQAFFRLNESYRYLEVRVQRLLLSCGREFWGRGRGNKSFVKLKARNLSNCGLQTTYTRTTHFSLKTINVGSHTNPWIYCHWISCLSKPSRGFCCTGRFENNCYRTHVSKLQSRTSVAGVLIKTQIAGPPSSFWFWGSGKAQDIMLKMGLLVEIIENTCPQPKKLGRF